MTTQNEDGTMIHACIDVALPVEQLYEASRRAIDENAANAPAIPRGSVPPGQGGPSPLALAALTGKLWKAGRTLRCRFLDGDATVQARLEPFAHEWEQYANIKFVFGNDPDAEIRISFKQPGSWSYLGTDALSIPKNQPTMNYGWLRRETDDQEYSRVVVHEFGHALGCIHEHQNPATNIPWDKDAVYRYYQGPPNNWTRAQVDTNLFTRYSAGITQFSEFDRESIMLYPIPNALTIGDYEVGWNTKLSAQDKTFVGALYPFAHKLENELKIDAPATGASIGQYGEVDTYQFAVAQEGTYRLETEGRLDLVMSLFGPNDPAHFVAMDDDSGDRLNARIVTALKPGVYTVRVRHYSARRTGEYKVGVYSGS